MDTNKIDAAAKALWDAYMEYNPEGEYLGISFIVDKNGVNFHVNNAYFEEGNIDAQHPLEHDIYL